MRPTEFYKNKLQKEVLVLENVNKQISKNTILRLVFFLGIPGFLFGLAQFSLLIAIILSVSCLIVFGTLIKRHIRLTHKRNFTKAMVEILEAEIDACNHVFSGFKEGNQFRNAAHHFSNDLDLFGPGSLFQMINRTVTESGQNLLAKQLLTEPEDFTPINQLQETIKELSTKSELNLKFRATGTLAKTAKEDKVGLIEWINSKSFIQRHGGLKILRYLLPGCTLVSLFVLIFTAKLGAIFTSLFVLNLILVGFFTKRIGKEHNQVSTFYTKLKNYTALLNTIEKESFDSELLADLVTRFKSNGNNASSAIAKLTKAVNNFDSRLNLIAAVILEGLFLWDFHCLVNIERWKKNYGPRLIEWMDGVAEMDAYLSMATFAFNNPNNTYPTENNGYILKASQVGHPFITESVRVCNDFFIKSKGDFIIVTGANMAGKSTFLRTIGVNLIIARSGMPVCATNFEFKPTKLFTSMRTSDSLTENESYFFAELKRLKELIDMLEQGEELFIMLDEILKGTNSVDKQKGSKMALEKILQLKGTGIIATHDLALTEIEKDYPDKVKNHCFEIEIDNAKIDFDYKLYQGVTKNMNAMLLMEQMGIV